eukprot:5712769-Prymnesium_polylepis.1
MAWSISDACASSVMLAQTGFTRSWSRGRLVLLSPITSDAMSPTHGLTIVEQSEGWAWVPSGWSGAPQPGEAQLLLASWS